MSHQPSASHTLPELRLKRGEDRRLSAGHLWVFSNEVDTARTPLPGFDENAYVPAMRADERPLAALLEEWLNGRRATISCLRGLPADTWSRRGVASGKEISVRALAYVIAGHTRHHLEVLAERYR